MSHKVLKFLIFIAILVTLICCPAIIALGIGTVLTAAGYIILLAPILFLTWLLSKLVYRMLFGKR